MMVKKEVKTMLLLLVVFDTRLKLKRYRNRAKNASRYSRENTRSARIESREVRKGVIPESF